MKIYLSGSLECLVCSTKKIKAVRAEAWRLAVTTMLSTAQTCIC